MGKELELDGRKIAEAALALLSLTEDDSGRVWKALDWGLMDTLHAEGWISDPATKARSVLLTEKGQALARTFLAKHFSEEASSGSRGRASAAAKKTAQKAAVPVRLDQAMALRCTAKLLKELRVKPAEVPEEISPARDWHATLVTLERRKCLMVTHTQTLYTVVLLGVRKVDLDHLGERLAARLRANLRSEGAADHELVVPSLSPGLVYAKTNNRSVLGSMNDLCFQLEWILEAQGGLARADEGAVAQQLNRTPMVGGLGGARPADAMRALLQGAAHLVETNE